MMQLYMKSHKWHAYGFYPVCEGLSLRAAMTKLTVSFEEAMVERMSIVDKFANVCWF